MPLRSWLCNGWRGRGLYFLFVAPGTTGSRSWADGGYIMNIRDETSGVGSGPRLQVETSHASDSNTLGNIYSGQIFLHHLPRGDTVLIIRIKSVLLTVQTWTLYIKPIKVEESVGVVSQRIGKPSVNSYGSVPVDCSQPPGRSIFKVCN